MSKALARTYGRILAAATLAVALVVPAFADIDPSAIGVVKTVNGAAFIDRGGRSLQPAPGTRVHLGDALRTGDAGSMGVTLRDGTIIALGSHSQFVVETYLFQPQSRLFGFVGRLLRGEAVYTSGDIGRLAPESVEIHVPGGVVGVRGTRFAARAP